MPKAIVQQAGAQSCAVFLAGIKRRVRTAQVKAALAANAELVRHYREIGREILANQKRQGWAFSVAGKNQTVVEYTLRDAKSPIGVAEYRLLPPKLKTKLPETRELKKLVAQRESSR